MVSQDRVISGIQRYIDSELVPKMVGWQKWVFGVGSGVILSKSGVLIDSLKGNPIIVSCGIMRDNEIDVETIYQEMKKKAGTLGVLEIDIPMIGRISLNDYDIDRIYQYIMS